MRVGAQINLVSYVVDGLRHTVFQDSATLAGSDLLSPGLCCLVIVAFGLSDILLAYGALKKTIGKTKANGVKTTVLYSPSRKETRAGNFSGTKLPQT